MPITPGPPLQKVTLNLYAADIIYMKDHFPVGYTEVIREWLHERVKQDALEEVWDGERSQPFDGKIR